MTSEMPADVAMIALSAFAEGDGATFLHHATASSIARWSQAWRSRIAQTLDPGPLRHPPGMPPGVARYNAEQWALMVARDAYRMRGTFGGIGALSELFGLSDASLLSRAWGGIPPARRTSRQLPGVIFDGEDTAYVLASLAFRHEMEGPCVLRLVRTHDTWRVVVEPEALYALPGLAGRTYNAGWLALSSEAE